MPAENYDWAAAKQRIFDRLGIDENTDPWDSDTWSDKLKAAHASHYQATKQDPYFDIDSDYYEEFLPENITGGSQTPAVEATTAASAPSAAPSIAPTSIIQKADTGSSAEQIPVTGPNGEFAGHFGVWKNPQGAVIGTFGPYAFDDVNAPHDEKLQEMQNMSNGSFQRLKDNIKKYPGNHDGSSSSQGTFVPSNEALYQRIKGAPTDMGDNEPEDEEQIDEFPSSGTTAGEGGVRYTISDTPAGKGTSGDPLNFKVSRPNNDWGKGGTLLMAKTPTLNVTAKSHDKVLSNMIFMQVHHKPSGILLNDSMHGDITNPRHLADAEARLRELTARLNEHGDNALLQTSDGRYPQEGDTIHVPVFDRFTGKGTISSHTIGSVDDEGNTTFIDDLGRINIAGPTKNNIIADEVHRHFLDKSLAQKELYRETTRWQEAKAAGRYDEPYKSQGTSAESTTNETPVSTPAVASAPASTPTSIPAKPVKQGPKDKNFGYFKENGDLEDDPEKIAAAMSIVYKGVKNYYTDDNGKEKTKMVDTDLPSLVYNHPTSKAKVDIKASRVWRNRENPGYFLSVDREQGGNLYDNADYGNRLIVQPSVYNVRTRYTGAEKEYNYVPLSSPGSTVSMKDGTPGPNLHASEFTEDFLRTHYAPQAAAVIAARHAILNSKAKGDTKNTDEEDDRIYRAAETVFDSKNRPSVKTAEEKPTTTPTTDEKPEVEEAPQEIKTANNVSQQMGGTVSVTPTQTETSSETNAGTENMDDYWQSIKNDYRDGYRGGKGREATAAKKRLAKYPIFKHFDDLTNAKKALDIPSDKLGPKGEGRVGEAVPPGKQFATISPGDSDEYASRATRHNELTLALADVSKHFTDFMGKKEPLPTTLAPEHDYSHLLGPVQDSSGVINLKSDLGDGPFDYNGINDYRFGKGTFGYEMTPMDAPIRPMTTAGKTSAGLGASQKRAPAKKTPAGISKFATADNNPSPSYKVKTTLTSFDPEHFTNRRKDRPQTVVLAHKKAFLMSKMNELHPLPTQEEKAGMSSAEHQSVVDQVFKTRTSWLKSSMEGNVDHMLPAQNS